MLYSGLGLGITVVDVSTFKVSLLTILYALVSLSLISISAVVSCLLLNVLLVYVHVSTGVQMPAEHRCFYKNTTVDCSVVLCRIYMNSCTHINTHTRARTHTHTHFLRYMYI